MSLAIDGMKAGAADFLNKPWNNDFLLDSVRTALKLSQKETSRKASGRDQSHQRVGPDYRRKWHRQRAHRGSHPRKQ